MTIKINGEIARRPLVNGVRAEDEISTYTIKYQLEDYPRGHVVPVEINSFGGVAIECERIQKMLVRHHSPVDITITAIAAAGAAWIALASRNVVMHEKGMLHLSMPRVACDLSSATELRRQADKLDRIAECAAETIAQQRQRRGHDFDEYYVLDLMLEEAWLSATEAFKLGLIDDILYDAEVAA